MSSSDNQSYEEFIKIIDKINYSEFNTENFVKFNNCKVFLTGNIGNFHAQNYTKTIISKIKGAFIQESDYVKLPIKSN